MVRAHAYGLGRVATSNFRRLTFPYKLNFIVTDRCNSRCRACRIWEKSPEDELTLAEIKTFFSRSKDFSWVDLSGGEIFLRDDIVEIAAAILENCRRLALLHFPTNGLFVERTVECTRRILDLSPPRLVVTVSVDGPRQLHDTIRGVKGSFDSALETYLGLRELAGCEVYLGMTLMPENQDRYEETLDALRQAAPWVTPSDLHVNVMHHSAHYYGNMGRPVPDGEVIRHEIDKIAKRQKRTISPLSILEHHYLSRVGRFLESGRSPLPCRALSASCFLSPDGVVYPCAVFDRPLGSLRDSDYDLKKIWDAPRTKEVLREIRREDCPGCWTPCDAFPTIAGNLLRLGI